MDSRCRACQLNTLHTILARQWSQSRAGNLRIYRQAQLDLTKKHSHLSHCLVPLSIFLSLLSLLRFPSLFFFAVSKLAGYSCNWQHVVKRHSSTPAAATHISVGVNGICESAGPTGAAAESTATSGVRLPDRLLSSFPSLGHHACERQNATGAGQGERKERQRYR